MTAATIHGPTRNTLATTPNVLDELYARIESGSPTTSPPTISRNESWPGPGLGHRRLSTFTGVTPSRSNAPVFLTVQPSRLAFGTLGAPPGRRLPAVDGVREGPSASDGPEAANDQPASLRTDQARPDVAATSSASRSRPTRLAEPMSTSHGVPMKLSPGTSVTPPDWRGSPSSSRTGSSIHPNAGR